MDYFFYLYISDKYLVFRKEKYIHLGNQFHYKKYKERNRNISKKFVFIFHHSIFFNFFIWVFFHVHSRITGLQGKGESISLTPHYHFHPLHRHLDINQAITAESSPLHIGSNRTQTGKLDSNQKTFGFL